MMKRKAVIFDMDGVIVDSEPRHERAFLQVAREIGFENHGLQFSDYIGKSDQELWVDFMKRNNPPHPLAELLARKRQVVLEIIKQDEPVFDGLPELVEKLAASYVLAVASGSERPVVEAVLSLKGIGRFFSITVTSWDVRHGKPAPDIFLRAAELLEVTPGECWVIEDSKPGIAAAQAAGMAVIAITNTHCREELGHATHVVASYSEIEKILLRP
jgi:HAD superfamily hydrolase (TIGR01509 family)